MANQMHLKRIAADSSVVNTTSVNSDFRVEADGEAYISQRKAAELLGVDQSSVSRFCASRNLDSKQGLNSEIFANALFYFSTSSRKKNSKSIELSRYLNDIKNWTFEDVLRFEYTPESKKDASGFIYLLQCNDYYKIGVSKTSVEERVRALETGNPYGINIIFYKKVRNCYRAERNLHLEYGDFHHKNEWFTGFNVEEVIASMSKIR